MTLGLPPFDDDDSEFLISVDRLVGGVVAAHQPARFMVIRIDNWFGDRWLKFSGKTLGALGVRNFEEAIVPPFVPNRVTAQSLFVHSAPYTYVHEGSGPDVHRSQPSGDNLHNRLRDAFPDTALFWVSGNSQANGRGSVMGYVPVQGTYWSWYVEYQRGAPWRTSKRINFADSDAAASEAHGQRLALGP